MTQTLYLVAGLGKTGHSIASYLKRCNLPFIVFDTRKEVNGLDAFQQEFPGVEVFLGELPDAIYDQLTEIITSPGISLEEPFLQKAKQKNISVIGDIECLARNITAPVIAITGTNGKSTVTTLVGEMAKQAGLSVAVAGNIGLPVLDLLDDEHSYDLWVLELSSFQLDLIESLKPVASTVLNISPDHLDRHHTMAQYTQSKHRVYKNSTQLIYNREDSATEPQKGTAVTRSSFGLNEPEAGQWGIHSQGNDSWLAFGDAVLLKTDDLRIKGRHNWQNALAACALAKVVGIDQQSMLTVLRTFAGLPHRSQWVRTLDGVDWINDSKGTNIGATISAITGVGGAISGKIVLIAGGLGKGADFRELVPATAEYVRAVILIGADASKIATALQGVVPTLSATSLENAVETARLQAIAGDVVLLSPACASMDMFKDFNHRGEVFTAAVNRL